EPGMGDDLLIIAFVVIIIGGIGSITGAFVAAILVGLLDTLGRQLAVDIANLVFDASAANQIGPALASMLVYVVMAAILIVRPTGLFAPRGA
ncbi:MAG: branched-chain amino acid ABC transporter permease, partial [Pseudomonadota bacterium]